MNNSNIILYEVDAPYLCLSKPVPVNRDTLAGVVSNLYIEIEIIKIAPLDSTQFYLFFDIYCNILSSITGVIGAADRCVEIC